MTASTELDKEKGLELFCMYFHMLLVLVVQKNVSVIIILGKWFEQLQR